MADRELGPQPGETVLELGAGVGDTGFEAAAILGRGGRLISTDFCPEMVEVARRRGTELGLGNVEYRVIDAERIELDSGSADGVLCQSTCVGSPCKRELGSHRDLGVAPAGDRALQGGEPPP